MLPRSGSLANLFYDDILGKIFIDSLFPLETIWGIHLPLLVTFHFCNGIGNKYTYINFKPCLLNVNFKPCSWHILRKFMWYLLIIFTRIFSSIQLTLTKKSQSKQCKSSWIWLLIFPNKTVERVLRTSTYTSLPK